MLGFFEVLEASDAPLREAVREVQRLALLLAPQLLDLALVRASAIELTARLLETVDTLQPSDTRVMPDYALPALSRDTS